jgi:hypothetical protein
MKIFASYIIAALSLTLAFSAAAEAQIRVIAQVDTSQDVYVGESFTYQIVIDGEEKSPQVDLAPLAQYNPRSAGGGPASQTSISIMNGKTTQTVIKRYVANYLLTANNAGPLQIPALTLTLDGKTYTTNAVSVNILTAGTTDLLDLEAALSETTCYVGQPVVMKINFYISADIGDFEFNIPAFTNDLFDLDDPDVTDPGAKEYRLTSGVNVFVIQHRVVHNSKDSILLSFSKVLIPKRSGQIPIDAASVSAEVAVSRARSRDAFFDDFFGSRKTYKRFSVSSKPLELNVLALPEQDKPPQFYGLVGRYNIAASATPTKVNVGDPITLTIKIGGSKYLKSVQWPDLENVSELAANFKIPAQKASPTLEDGFKVFTQTIRANNDDVTEIPPIGLAFFDADQGKYIVAQTSSIPLEVAPTKILTDADLEGTQFTPVNKEIEAIKKGISANYEGPDVLVNMQFAPFAAVLSPSYVPIWLVPLGAFVFSIFAKLVTHTTPERQAQKRRRQASSKAVRQLRKISSSPAKDRPGILISVMKQYIGDRFDKYPGSLTADDCRQIIAANTNEAQTAECYGETIAKVEASRYAPLETNIDPEKITEIIKLIRTIEKKSRK